MASQLYRLRHPKRWALLMVSLAGGALLVWQARVTAEPQQRTAPVEQEPVQKAADRATPPSSPSAPSAQTKPSGPSTADGKSAAESADGVAEEPPPKPPQDPEHAHITFSTIPSTNAKVVWGRKTLGMIRWGRALKVVRPRDSGPLDVMIYAPGYLPVQTRAHTFEDSNIVVRLTTPEDMPNLWGYRAPLDAGVPDAGEAAADEVLPLPEEVAAQPL